VRVALITVSDSVSSGEREDRSGPALREQCQRLGWLVHSTYVVPDAQDVIETRLIEVADAGATDLILTTGGTGIGPRDCTPEATAAVSKKLLPGIVEVMRDKGRASTPRAVLSRAVAGVRGRTLIVNLPGSPKGAIESLDAVAPLIPHVVDLLEGRTSHADVPH